MREARFSLQIFIVGAILSVTFFLLFIDAFKTYNSAVTILVSAKSEIASRQQEQIISSILEFPRTLSFYDRLLKYNKDVRDIAIGKNPDQRKKIWNEMFSIERVGGNSSIIKIAITAKQEPDADQLAQKTTRTLLDVVAMYYNVKDDIDLRIIDGPITHSNVTGWYWTGPLSVMLGFFIAAFLQYLLSGSREIFIGKRSFLKEKNLFDFKKETQEESRQGIKALEDLYISEEAAAPFVIRKKAPDTKTQEMKKITKMLEPDKYPNFSEMPKVGAPANLPIADDSFSQQHPVEIVEHLIIEKAPQEEKTEMKVHAEPTPEQLKERLNKLLKGEM